MKNFIKIYGERNTNTNYVSKLIKLNISAKEISGIVPEYLRVIQKLLPGNEWIRDLYFLFTYQYNLGWKHTKATDVTTLNKYYIYKNNNIYFLTLTKNPYSWLLSLYRRPYHQIQKPSSTFEEFLITPWKTNRRENVKGILPNPIALWNIKNNSYRFLPPSRTINFTSEKIIEDPECAINKICSIFNIAKISKRFINYDKSTKDNSKDSNYYRDYYLKEKWINEIPKKSISYINEQIDPNLMKYFGYDFL